MRKLLAILFVPLAAPIATAKCSRPVVEVTGTVSNGAGARVAGAVVAVAWLRREELEGPVQSHTDQQGVFRVLFPFDTFSKIGMLRGDVCRESISQVSVSAYSPGYRAEPVLAPVENWSAKAALVLDAFAE